MKALIIGATGATGKDLPMSCFRIRPGVHGSCNICTPSSWHEPSQVIRSSDYFDKLEEVAGYIKGDVWFSCLGTTLKTAGSKDKQWHIDYEIPLKFAEIARKNGVSKIVLLSAYGASAISKTFYSWMKGKLEEGIASLAFDQYIIFRPGLLLRKDTDRTGERIAARVLNFLNSLGVLKKFKPLPTSVLAEKLAKAPKVLAAGKHVIALDEIFRF